jgi:hypothetical protein
MTQKQIRRASTGNLLSRLMYLSEIRGQRIGFQIYIDAINKYVNPELNLILDEILSRTK